MVTFLSGGTGTPKLLSGFSERGDAVVIGNTGDDIELGGHLVCPDLDSVLYLGAGLLDLDTWWGIEDDPSVTHEFLQSIADATGWSASPRPLPPEKQESGREIATWRRFSAVGEFMLIGDRDRAIHLTRTSLLDEGHSLTEVTSMLADAFDLEFELLPMSNDPVASYIHTDVGVMHFQEYWVGHRAEPTVTAVEFRGSERASPTDEALTALTDTVVIGPSNPITSIGPILALDGVSEALATTTVVCVSPFVEDTVFSGPAGELMDATGYPPSTAGVAEAFPFVDAFVLDTQDGTELDRPVVRTDTTLGTTTDSARVMDACSRAIEVA